MKKAQIWLCTALVVLMPYNAAADFIGNFAAWQALSPPAQYAYVMGLYDGKTNSFYVGEENWILAERLGTVDCAKSVQLNGLMLADAITRFYQTHPSDWKFPVSLVYQRVVLEICIDYINGKRAQFNLSPWPVRKGSLSDEVKQQK